MRLAGRDRAEEPVRLVVRAGGEEEGVRVAVRAGVAELECPEAVDRELAPVRIPERAAVLEDPGADLGVGVDPAVAEVADEQVAAEAAERGRRPREAPRRIQLAVLRDPLEGAAV